MLTLGEIQHSMSQIKDWSLEGNSIVKDFSFQDFKQALDFVNKVGDLAEKQEHHPDIQLSYGKVRLTLTTHKEMAITKKDFDLAKEIDKI